LSFTSETEIGIVEMGANLKLNFGEVANPDYGYITNFGKRIRGLWVEGVIEGKSEMYQNLKANDKLLFC
jgi:UDP-N-acetylmuramoyl-tripeptide--D-alanyl-D-alanine ligase